MATNTQNTYVSDGTTTEYSITFEYINTEDVKVSIDEQDTTEWEFIDPVTIDLNEAPPEGENIRIYRRTNVDSLANEFFPGSAIRADDLNEDFEQVLFVSQESQRDSELSYSALPIAAEARQIANAADAKSEQAMEQAAQAVETSNTAEANSIQAVNTSNDAEAKADNAVEVATAAANSVSDVVNYELVANVAAIPGSPTVDSRVEVIDSTGIEGFSPLDGLPNGFVGDPGKSVRINRNNANTTWQFVSYVVLDPDSRFANIAGDTFTGPVSAPSFTGPLTGDVTGNVTGDVTGNFTGDITGDVTGNLTGNVTGDVTGNCSGTHTGPVVGDVTGNLNGNATSATTATNASKLENLNSTQFLRSDVADQADGDLTFRGDVYFNNGNKDVYFTNNVALYYGTGNASRFIHNGSNLYLDLFGGTSQFLIRDGSNAKFIFSKNGNLDIGGDYSCAGDIISTAGKINNTTFGRSVAGLGSNGVGSYHLCSKKGGTGALSAGDETSGSNLRGVTVGGSNSGSGTNKGGTWRCCGMANDNVENYGPGGATVYVRVA